MANTTNVKKRKSHTQIKIEETSEMSQPERSQMQKLDSDELMTSFKKFTASAEDALNERNREIKILKAKISSLQDIVAEKSMAEEGLTFAQKAKQNEARIVDLRAAVVNKDEQLARLELKLEQDVKKAMQSSHKGCEKKIEQQRIELVALGARASNLSELHSLMETKEKQSKKEVRDLQNEVDRLKNQKDNLEKQLIELEAFGEVEDVGKLKDVVRGFADEDPEEWANFGGNFGEKVRHLIELANSL